MYIFSGKFPEQKLNKYSYSRLNKEEEEEEVKSIDKIDQAKKNGNKKTFPR